MNQRRFTSVVFAGPRKMPAKITVRLRDGTVIEYEVQDYPGPAFRFGV